MSADNFMYIDVDGARFVVSMGFASDSGVARHKHDPRFDTLGEAMDYAEGESTEYGITMSGDVQALIRDIRPKVGGGADGAA